MLAGYARTSRSRAHSAARARGVAQLRRCQRARVCAPPGPRVPGGRGDRARCAHAERHRGRRHAGTARQSSRENDGDLGARGRHAFGASADAGAAVQGSSCLCGGHAARARPQQGAPHAPRAARRASSPSAVIPLPATPLLARPRFARGQLSRARVHVASTAACPPRGVQVILEKGHSQMDWMNLTRRAPDLAGLGGGRPRKLTLDEARAARGDAAGTRSACCLRPHACGRPFTAVAEH